MADIAQLLQIMARLRDPDGGCPWDLEQDFASISPHTIEEAYEVDEAIASGDLEALRDELGDLLFQVVFQARLAEEQGAFDFSGVTAAIVDKLVRRHPHVFAEAETPTTAEGQLLNWEEIKAAERASTHLDGPPDPFVGIPRKLPALARSAKIVGRLARIEDARGERVAADEFEVETLLGRLASEREELDRAARSKAAGSPPDASVASLIGRGLQTWARLARKLGVDPEQALRELDDETMARARVKVHQASNSPHR